LTYGEPSRPDRNGRLGFRFVTVDHRFRAMVAVQCNEQCNGARPEIVGPGRSGSLSLANQPGVERKARKGVECPLNVQKLRVGADVRRELRVAMTHRGLSRSQWHPAPAEKRAESGSQCMHVERPDPAVALRDAGGFQVAVENLFGE